MLIFNMFLKKVEKFNLFFNIFGKTLIFNIFLKKVENSTYFLIYLENINF